MSGLPESGPISHGGAFVIATTIPAAQRLAFRRDVDLPFTVSAKAIGAERARAPPRWPSETRERTSRRGRGDGVEAAAL